MLVLVFPYHKRELKGCHPSFEGWHPFNSLLLPFTKHFEQNNLPDCYTSDLKYFVMKPQHLKYATWVLIGLFGSDVLAQQSISTAGGSASGSGGSVNYSIGQVFNNTISGSNGSIATGVQQPFEISVVTGIEEAEDITLQYAVFPNPAFDYLKLFVENSANKKLIYRLYDFHGKLLQTIKPIENLTYINVVKLLPGIYLLRIFDNDIEIKAFKIIKN